MKGKQVRACTLSRYSCVFKGANPTPAMEQPCDFFATLPTHEKQYGRMG